METTDVISGNQADQTMIATAHYIEAARSHASLVDTLEGPLDTDIRDSAEACWSIKAKSVQVKSKLLVSFRSRQVVVHVPDFVSEAEQQLLGAALKQWQNSAEGAVAASALDMQVAEQRLRHAVFRQIEQEGVDASSLQDLLKHFLTVAADLTKPGDSYAAASGVVQELVLCTGFKYLKVASEGKSDDTASPVYQLIQVLLKHPQQMPWAASLLQASAQELPSLLQTVLQQPRDTAESATGATAWNAEQLFAAETIVKQLPWEHIAESETIALKTDVCMPIFQFLGEFSRQSALPAAEAKSLVQTLMKALLSIAEMQPELFLPVQTGIQATLLAVSTAASVQATLDALGGSLDNAAEASPLIWAQLAAAAHTGCSNKSIPLAIVYSLDWDETAVNLPDRQKTTALLTLASIAGAAHTGSDSQQKQQYLTWLWHLLLSPAGKSLVQLDTAKVDEYGTLCKAKAPGRSDEVKAIWSWVQLQLANGLLEYWSTSASESSTQASALLADIDFFGLPQTLVDAAQPEAVVQVMLRFLDAATALGDGFIRQHLGEAASALGPSLRPVAGGGSSTGVAPIKAALQRLIRRGIAVNEATQTPPEQESPGSSPHDSARSARASQRGSTTSPGQEALAKAADLLALLVCCHVKAGLAPDGLVLINDLVQLLYYHGSSVAHRPEEEPADESIHLLSPLVQESMGAVVEVVGVQATRDLWTPLMHLEGTNPRQLQWLAVLACWLSNTAGILPGTAASASPETSKEQSPTSPHKKLQHSATPKSLDKAAAPTSDNADAKDAEVFALESYPSPPGGSPTHGNLPPPPAYEEVMKKSDMQRLSGSAGSSLRTAQHAAGQLPPSPDTAAGNSPSAGLKVEIVDRNAEEALQIQEAAKGIGYGAAALSLWEEFVIRFFKYETQLGPVLPKQDIANHLQQLAQLYQNSSPVLSDIYTLLSCLSPEQLPGGTPRVVAENKAALQSLMQLHPLNLTKSSSNFAEPPSPNPLVDKNPFGSVPLSALRESPKSVSSKRQPNRSNDTGHFGAVLAESTATLQDDTEEEDSTEQRKPHTLFSRPAADNSASYATFVKDQEGLAEKISLARAAVRPWARRAEKQAAIAPQSSQAQLTSTGSGKLPLARELSKTSSALGSPLGSAGSGRGIDAFLARSTRDGDVPEIISQAQGKLWELSSASSEELERVHAAMRELICRRYKHTDLDKIANGDLGDVEEVMPHEDPSYQQQMQGYREAACKVVHDLCFHQGLTQAARLLYQLEVLLLQKGSKMADADDVEIDTDSRCQLLLVLAEVTLDGSAPPICTPLFTRLFCQAASGGVPVTPQTKVKLCRRILRALASNSQPQQQESEAVTLLKASLDPPTLLSGVSLQDFEACLDTILFHSHRLLPATVTSLLSCFHLTQYASRLLEGQSPRRAEQDEGSSAAWQGQRDVKVPKGVTRVMTLALATLSLKGGAAQGAALLQGLLVTGPASYYAAALQLAITGEEAEGRQAALQTLLQVPVESLPLPVLLDSAQQIAEALNSSHLAPPDLPHQLLHAFLQAPPILAALRTIIAGAASPSPGKQTGESSSEVFWSAKVGNTRPQDDNSSGSTSTSAPPSLGEPKQAVLLVPVHVGQSADQCLVQLLGAWLQSILRKYGSGLEAVALTEEFTSLLGSLFEPAGGQPWLVDWFWTLYESVLQPFLCLAGPASDGTAVTRFREYWQSLPWQKATFHCIAPDALQLLASFLYSSDRAVLQLLHVLNWQPVLQQIAPSTIQMAASDASTPQTSLLDVESSIAGTPTPASASAHKKKPLQTAKSLDAGAKAWAASLILLVLPTCVMLDHADLPAWLQQLLGSPPAEPSSPNAVRGLRLEHILAAADLKILQHQLAKKDLHGTPFLLQPLTAAPHLVEGEPNSHLLQLAKLLTNGAQLNGSAKAAAVAANTIQQMMMVSVCRGFTSAEGSDAGASAGAEAGLDILECWHLGTQELHSLVQDCLLPLASAHASMELAQNLQAAPESHPDAVQPSSTPGPTRVWQAPALSSLVSRLNQPGASPNPKLQAHSPGKVSPFASPAPALPEQVYLDASSDEEEVAPARSEATAAAESGSEALSIYTTAAEPFKALLACIHNPPEMLVTLEPLPFANAEGPLKVLPTQQHAQTGSNLVQDSARQASSLSHNPGQSTAGKQSSVTNLKSRMAALKKGMGIGNSDAKGTKLAVAAAATDAGAIQHCLACIVQEALQEAKPEVGVCLLRVTFINGLSVASPVSAALTEDLILGLLLRQQTRAGGHAEASFTRQGSYTEAQLGAPVPHQEALLVEAATYPIASDAAQAIPSPEKCLEGLSQQALLSLCQTAATAHMPLTAWLSLKQLQQHGLKLEPMQWRDLVSGILEVASKMRAHPVTPLHIVYPWLQLLHLLADARWRKLDAAAPLEQLQQFLDVLQGHVAMLWVAHPHENHEETGLFAGAAERLRVAKSEVKARLQRDSGSTGPPSTPPSPALLSKGSGSLLGSSLTQEEGISSRVGAGFKNLLGSNKASAGQPASAGAAEPGSQKAGRFASLRAKMTKSNDTGKVDQQPGAEQPLAGKLTGLKNRLLRPSSASSSSAALPPQQPLLYDSSAPAEHDTGLLEDNRPADAQHVQPERSAPSGKTNLTDRFAGNFRKAIGIGTKGADSKSQAETEAAQAAAQSAEALVQVALAAFAISAYIRATLCPSLQTYEPQPAMQTIQASGKHTKPSVQQAVYTTPFTLQRTRNAYQDLTGFENLAQTDMHQVSEIIHDLDSLNDVCTQSSLVATNNTFLNRFHSQIELLLSNSTPVDSFHHSMQTLLLPVTDAG